MSFGALNIDVALQISNKILFEESFGYALSFVPVTSIPVVVRVLGVKSSLLT